MNVKPPSPEQIRQQLAAIFGNEAFASSQRSRKLLEFLVEETLAGRGDRLKGFYIACEFLGRGADFDPLIDPIVRIEMGKLRRALEHYYLTGGKDDALRIEVPKGNYQPLFLPASVLPVPAPQAAVHDGLPLLGRASLVIRPFTSDDSPLARDFSAGLAQQLAALLNRLDDIYVLAGDAEDASGVRFLLHAQIRASGQRLRIAVQLEDRLQSHQVWAESFTEQADDLFALEDEISRRIANQIADPNRGEMFKALAASVSGRAQASPEEIVARFNTDHVQRMNDLVWQREVRQALQQLVDNQPDFAAARAALSKAIHDAYLQDEADINDMSYALQHARHAVKLEPDSQHALAALTNAYIALGDHDRAMQAIERTLELNRTGHSARAFAAYKLLMLGEATRVEPLLREQLAASGGKDVSLRVGLALLAYFRGEYVEVLASVSRDLLASTLWGGMLKVACLAETGDLEAARKELDGLLDSYPRFARNPARQLSVSLYRKDWQAQLLASLGKAGLN